jgi:predicted tellurium resistance membrane protein TerC
MAAALVAAMVLMLVAAEPLSEFLARHPTVKMLTLAFVLMIGLTLLAEGLGVHVPKAYLYFAIGVAITIEALNLLIRHRQKPVRLRHPTP